MDTCPGTITVEYYDESSDFSDSEQSEFPNYPPEHSPSSSPCSSTSTQNIRDSISCKTYDFKHGSETEYNDKDDEGELARSRIFSEMAREAIDGHFLITHQEHKQSLMHPKASFPRCPRGDIPEQYGRRKHPGPFLTCSFSHSHECGDDFLQIPISTKPTPELNTLTRPHHLKEKKAKFFKQCKQCETIGFTHHRNPARHYEDYLNNVTYKQHNDHTKVWQQHVVDLMFTMGENSNSSCSTLCADVGLVEKCKNYQPSDAIVKAMRYTRNIQRRISTVISRRKPAIARPLRRPLPKTNASKVSSLTNTNRRLSFPEHKNNMASDVTQKKYLPASGNHSPRLQDRTTRSGRSQKMPKEKHLHSIRRSPSSDFNIDGCKPSALHQRLQESVTRLINSRQASSKVSKRFVKKLEPPKEAKYVQRGKPNISAKFLRARSKNKTLHCTKQSSHLTSPRASRSKGKSSINSKKRRSAQAKQERKFGKSNAQHKTSSLKDDESSDDGSYAQFRDQNGEFDVEKYRQSILKMLSKNLDDGTGEKRKTIKKFAQSNQTNFVALPRIRNVYRNVQPRITSNFTQRKRRKGRKTKADNFGAQLSNDVSLKSNYWNEDSLTSKDSF